MNKMMMLTSYLLVLCITQSIVVISTSDFLFCVGSNFNCVGNFKGMLKCFGENNNGELGQDNRVDRGSAPNQMGSNLPFINLGFNMTAKQISCGEAHVCAILDDNKGAKCWGYNNRGQLGLSAGGADHRGDQANEMGDRLPLINLGTGIIPVQVAAGQAHTCIKFDNNQIKCFGRNFNGQLGYGNTTDRGGIGDSMGDTLPFVDLGIGVEVLSVHASRQTRVSCTILSAPAPAAQRLKCWGVNNHLQLGYANDIGSPGDGPNEMGDFLPLVNLGTESRVKSVSIGAEHTCVITFVDDVKCWGSNAFGQLGLGSTNGVSTMGSSLQITPVDSGGKKAAMLSCGHRHTCFLLDDFLTVKCIGLNDKGQLGQGDINNRGTLPENTAEDIPAIDLGTGSLQIKYIDAGSSHTCIAFVDKGIKCFGLGSSGQLGQGNINDIGDGFGEMGTNISFIDIFQATSAPTKNPTRSPTSSTSEPTKSPTNPTSTPTKNPTRSPTYPTSEPTRSPTRSPTSSTSEPTKSPTNPTSEPTKSPTNPTSTPTKSPTAAPNDNGTNSPSKSPSLVPTTGTPTLSPTVKPTKSPSRSPTQSPTATVAVYVPPKKDCYMITDKIQCESENDGHCGACLFFANRVFYGFRVRIDFVMEGNRRFSEFESTVPSITTFKDAIKALLVTNIDGEERISINKIGQIYQATGSRSGYVDYEIKFIDKESSKEAAKAYFFSKPDGEEYVDDLNAELNKKLKTTGRKYITGSIRINNLNIIDRDNGKGSCGCPSDVSSNSVSMFLATTFCIKLISIGCFVRLSLTF